MKSSEKYFCKECQTSSQPYRATHIKAEFNPSEYIHSVNVCGKISPMSLMAHNILCCLMMNLHRIFEVYRNQKFIGKSN